MKLSDIEKSVVLALFKSGKTIDAFTLFRRLKVSFSDFSRSINTLSENSFIEDNDGRISLTNKSLQEFSSFERDYREKSWRKVPEKYIRPSFALKEMYVPSIRLLDKRTFSCVKNNVYSPDPATASTLECSRSPD